jgi:hypothetical protein
VSDRRNEWETVTDFGEQASVGWSAVLRFARTPDRGEPVPPFPAQVRAAQIPAMYRVYPSLASPGLWHPLKKSWNTARVTGPTCSYHCRG